MDFSVVTYLAMWFFRVSIKTGFYRGGDIRARPYHTKKGWIVQIYAKKGLFGKKIHLGYSRDFESARMVGLNLSIRMDSMSAIGCSSSVNRNSVNYMQKDD